VNCHPLVLSATAIQFHGVSVTFVNTERANFHLKPQFSVLTKTFDPSLDESVILALAKSVTKNAIGQVRLSKREDEVHLVS
jgi:hypothetical protein